MNKNVTLYLFSNTDNFPVSKEDKKKKQVPRKHVIDNILNFAKSYHVQESENIENIELNLN